MKSCLGILCIFLLLCALIASIAYNVIVNNSLEFEARDNTPAHINTRRSNRTPSPTPAL